MKARAPERRAALAWVCFLAALFTLPWVGLGVGRLVTGRDLGAGVQPSWLLLALAVVLAAPELGRWVAARRRGLLIALGPLLASLLASGAGLMVAPSAEPAASAWWRFAKQVIQLDVMLLFVLVPAFFVASGRSLAVCARAVVAGALFQLAYGALQGLDHLAPGALPAVLERVFTSNPAIFAGSEHLYLGNVLQDIPRLRGTVCEPLYLGNFLLLALPLVGLTGWRPRVRAAVASGLVVLLVGTWSRGAWLAAGGGAVAFLVLARVWGLPLPWGRLGRGALLIAVAGLVAGMVAALLGWDAVWLPVRRLLQSFSTVDWSNLTRFYSMQAAWRGFLLSPLVGVGWGQFAFHYPALVDPMGLQAMFTWPVVNNFPLAILCETGLLGLGAWLWAGRALAATVRRAAAGAPPEQRMALALLCAGSVGIGLQLLTFSQYNLPHIWVAVGLLAGTVRHGEAIR